MPKEHEAEAKLRAWLKRRRLAARKGVDVDCEAWRGPKVTHLFEVKGDQKNYGARRHAFFIGLGQILVARSHSPKVPVSLALAKDYFEIVAKYADVLLRERISVFWIGDRVVKANLSVLRPSFRVVGHGDPNGRFSCGRASYRVVNGKLVSVTLDHQRVEGYGFKDLCRALGIRVGTDSAARVLSRRGTQIVENTKLFATAARSDPRGDHHAARADTRSDERARRPACGSAAAPLDGFTPITTGRM